MASVKINPLETTKFNISKEQKEKHDKARKLINEMHPCKDTFRAMLEERMKDGQNNR